MPISFIVIELFVFILAILVGIHSWRRGLRWFSTFLSSALFGLLVELSIVLSATPQKTHYIYGEFLLNVGPAGKMVPVWVGVGWGVIVYVATFTAYRMKTPWWLRPATAGLLAVNVDLSLDPMADLLGYWKWHNVDPTNYFGVPLDNFLGWFSIVAAFSLASRAGFRLIPKSVPGRDLWVAPLAALVALALTALIRTLADGLYLRLGEGVVFILVFAGTSAVTLGFALKSRRDNPRDSLVLAIPTSIHLLMLALFLGTSSLPLRPALVVVIPLSFLVGIFAYAWPSLDAFFPVPARPLVLAAEDGEKRA